MDDKKFAIFMDLMAVAVKIVIEETGICVWYKVSSSKK